MFKYYGNTEQQINYQRIATRIYILMIFVSFIILIFYTVLIRDIYREIVHQRSEFQYQVLQSLEDGKYIYVLRF
jgi:amino acid permease